MIISILPRKQPSKKIKINTKKKEFLVHRTLSHTRMVGEGKVFYEYIDPDININHAIYSTCSSGGSLNTLLDSEELIGVSGVSLSSACLAVLLSSGIVGTVSGST